MKKLEIHDKYTDEPTLCLTNDETNTCQIIAVFEPTKDARAIAEWLEMIIKERGGVEWE